MKKLFTIVIDTCILMALVSCSTTKISNNKETSHPNRSISSLDLNKLENKLDQLNWNFVTTKFKGLNYVYTPYFVENEKAVFITGGAGVNPGNGILKLKSSLVENNVMNSQMLIKSGPDLKNYNYFRAPRAAKAKNEVWVLSEMAGCYSGCDNAQFPKRIGAYHSVDFGETFKFLDFINVDGVPLVAEWFAQTGLIYNPDGSSVIDEVDLTRNKFITTGERLNILVSSDGINFKSFNLNYPYPKDRLIFTSLARTPFGYHMMTNANWSDKYYTIAVRHLFSQDLINWIPLESYASFKNPNFYKGIHLSYDVTANRLWAISPCGNDGACSFVGWLTPQDFSKTIILDSASDVIPTGEFVQYFGKTVMILGHRQSNEKTTYQIRFADGRIDSGFTKDMFQFPLKHYQRHGCATEEDQIICVGDAVSFSGVYAAVIGLYLGPDNIVKYALKYSTGNIDTGFLKKHLTLP